MPLINNKANIKQVNDVSLQSADIMPTSVLTEIFVNDYKNKINGIDITNAIKQIITDYSSGSIKIKIPRGEWIISSKIQAKESGIFLEGEGIYSTILRFKPTKNDAMFEWNTGLSTRNKIIWNGGLSKMSLISDESITFQKIGINLVDCSQMVFEQFKIEYWGGNNNNIGLYTHGRDLTDFKDLTIIAPNPIIIASNPNTAITPVLDCDHYHFNNTYLNATYGANIKVEDDVVITNLTFDGYQSWCLGTYGFYWDATANIQSSYKLKLSNVRTEQGLDPNSYSVYINAFSLQGLVIENSVFDETRKGMYLRNIQRPSLRDVTCENDMALNVDFCDSLILDNCFTIGGTAVSLGKMIEVLSLGKINNESPTPDFVYYRNVSDGAISSQKPIKIYGTNVWNWSGTLADSTDMLLPLTTSKICMVNLAARNMKKNFLAGATVICSNNKATLLSSTKGSSIVSNDYGKLTFIKNVNGSTYIVNWTGFELEIVISVTFM
jgi:hypothetical protein